jgi:hypothetical protein
MLQLQTKVAVYLNATSTADKDRWKHHNYNCHNGKCNPASYSDRPASPEGEQQKTEGKSIIRTKGPKAQEQAFILEID